MLDDSPDDLGRRWVLPRTKGEAADGIEVAMRSAAFVLVGDDRAYVAVVGAAAAAAAALKADGGPDAAVLVVVRTMFPTLALLPFAGDNVDDDAGVGCCGLLL